jgi:hypothetical protein
VKAKLSIKGAGMLTMLRSKLSNEQLLEAAWTMAKNPNLAADPDDARALRAADEAAGVPRRKLKRKYNKRKAQSTANKVEI